MAGGGRASCLQNGLPLAAIQPKNEGAKAKEGPAAAVAYDLWEPRGWAGFWPTEEVSTGMVKKWPLGYMNTPAAEAVTRDHATYCMLI